jgi:NADPH2:quinone reductase
LKAALIPQAGASPVVEEFDDPTPPPGAVAIEVRTAGLGAWDVDGSYMMGAQYPCVVGGEGVGHAPDGRRVYFGAHSVRPFGAWAQRTVVPAEEVWDVPDDIDDKLAISLAIAGTGALVPLQQANIQPGENVLILGATGTVGQIALQLARYFGAGQVVAAARNQQALERVAERGLADDIAQIGAGDDVAALKRAAGQEFDVVLDLLYGEPFVAALKATRFGARLMSIGVQAGVTATLALPDLFSRTHACVGTGHRPAHERQALWRQLLDISRQHSFVLDYVEFTLDDAPLAWEAQKNSAHGKVLATI